MFIFWYVMYYYIIIEIFCWDGGSVGWGWGSVGGGGGGVDIVWRFGFVFVLLWINMFFFFKIIWFLLEKLFYFIDCLNVSLVYFGIILIVFFCLFFLYGFFFLWYVYGNIIDKDIVGYLFRYMLGFVFIKLCGNFF